MEGVDTHDIGDSDSKRGPVERPRGPATGGVEPGGKISRLAVLVLKLYIYAEPSGTHS